MNSICCGNNENPLSTITQSREVVISRQIFFSWHVFTRKCVQILYGTFAVKISIQPPPYNTVKKVGHPVPYIVPARTICMVIRNVAEKHLGRCGGQGGDFFGSRQRNSCHLLNYVCEEECELRMVANR